MKNSNFMFIGAVCALIALINADISETNGKYNPIEEHPVQKVNVLQPGEKEYLSPNLIGVQNIAITHIPETLNFINIIDAYRELVDGVRYEIVMNAVNTTDNNTEVICRVVVLEKPWLTNIWGDKLRLLQESNCTSESLPDVNRDRKSLEEKYETNALFTSNRNELKSEEMSNLESQIIVSSKNPQLVRQFAANPIISTTESVFTQPEEVATFAEQNSSPTQGEVSSVNDINAEDPIVSLNEATTTETIPELSNIEKKWLDDFLSVGAYNFETSLERDKTQKASNEAQFFSQESDKRSKRDLLGGVRQLDSEELKLHQENLSKSLSKLSSGDAPQLTVIDCFSGTSQVVAGSLVKLDCEMSDSKSGKKIRCVMSLWSQPWLKENGYEVTYDCKDKPKGVYRHSRSIENLQRKTRSVGLVGGIYKLSPEEVKTEEENLSTSLSKILATGEAPSLTNVEKCHSGSKQLVAGTLVKLDCDMFNNITGTKDRCLMSIWTQQWLPKDGYEVTFECKDTPKSVHRHSRSIDDRAEKRYKREHRGAAKPLNDFELKEQEGRVSQSLAKIASGDGPSYSISRAFNGTKQTVAGSLVKIYAELIDGNTGSKENCTVSLWSRPWIPIDGYEVSFECEDKPKSVHRHSRSTEYLEKKTNKKSHRSLDKAEHLFQKFQTQFKKNYHNSMERQMRLRIFKHNLKLIYDLNKNEMGSAKYGITEFADMTTTEYRERTGLLFRKESNSVHSPAQIPDVELPKEFDWREKAAVSKVKNQGSCGSCWAFSVTGNIEGLNAVKTGKLEEYSEQELLDCDTVDSACNGGLPDNAYQAIEKIGGLELESEYPYKAKKDQCHFKKNLAHVKISGAVDLPKNETDMAKWLIVNGPISIGINANAMQFYRGGVSHPWKMLCSKKSLDHGVLIVGYGVSEYPKFKKTLPYWIVKNSWGPKWGEQGYYRVYRGDNTCGVSEMATSAVLAS